MRNIWIGLLIASAAAPAHAGGPVLAHALTSNDQVGFAVSKKGRERSVSAVIGMWSDDGALELGGFQDGAGRDVDPSVTRAVELVSGRRMQSRGLRLTGAFYGSGAEQPGWTLAVEARQQRTSDVGAALAGAWRSASDSRLSFSGKLRF
jgi:hypothetical protein